MRETVLLYHFEDAARLSEVRIALMPLKLYVQEIGQADYNKPIGMFAGMTGVSTQQKTESLYGEIENEMMILCGLTERKLDRTLQALRRRKISVPYKAILTDSNKSWSGEALYHELVKEHKKIHNL